ncbi:MAG: hypothetical protein IPM42_22330 [Saprospiraceae bacterium]|nr:hypothetical protein [Saprospiraceae bacterium]
MESIETHSEENNSSKLKPVLTLEEAINDLPIPVRDVDEYPYNKKPLNDYQKKMRKRF